MSTRLVVSCRLIGVFLLLLSSAAVAQTNCWTNSTSGNWEDANWSLGVLPGTNQSVLLTNAGFKVLKISADTAANFPNSLTVDSLTISSPDNSANVLLMGDVGLQTPLRLNTFGVGTNCMILMYGSALQAISSSYLYNYVDGIFIQDGESEISVPIIYVDGIYQLNSGMLQTFSVEFGASGKFIQSGGTNVSLMSIADGPAEYDLEGGEFDGGIRVRNGTTFQQSGGVANASAVSVDDSFVQSGGVFNGPTNSLVSIPALLVENPTNAHVCQTGGTNQEYKILLGIPLAAESDCTFGCGHPIYGATYLLSNGMLTTFGTTLAANGYFQQSGGTNAISGDLNIGGSIGYVAGGGPAFTGPFHADYRNSASYTESGGLLSANNIGVGLVGSVNQLGGAVLVASSLTLGGPSMSEAGRGYSGSYTLQGGTLTVPDIEMGDGSQFQESNSSLAASNLNIYAGTFGQDSGTNAIAGGLSIQSHSVTNSYNSWSQDVTTYTGSYQLNGGALTASNLAVFDLGQFSQSGGQLLVSDIQLIGGGFFQTNGTIQQSGLLTLDGATWLSGAGRQQLGQLQLGASASTLFLPTSFCTLQFRDSSGLAWSNNAVLTIQNWSGSVYGGGAQQILFGNNSAGVTAQQLSVIHFQNPVGLPTGYYPARILATGEIVPDTGAPLAMKMSAACAATNSLMQLKLSGDIGQSYDIEVSTDLVNWIWWTNEFNTNGTIYLNDLDATNFPQRFYRARRAP